MCVCVCVCVCVCYVCVCVSVCVVCVCACLCVCVCCVCARSWSIYMTSAEGINVLKALIHAGMAGDMLSACDDTFFGGGHS